MSYGAHVVTRASELCTVDAAAAHLQVHRKTVLRYIRDGRIPATKIGRSYRIRSADLDTFTGSPIPAVTVSDAARATTIVDVPGVGPALASKIASSVTNSLRGGHERHGDIHAEVVHDADNAVLKIIVVGSIADTRSLLGLLQVWLEQLSA